MSRLVLPAKAIGETVRYELDLLSQLATGETISTVTVTCSVFAGDDDAPEDLILGLPWYSSTRVYQRVTGGTAGVIYLLTATITTSLSQTLVMYAYLATLTPSGSDVSLECCPRIGNATSADGQAFSMTFPDRPVTAYSDGLQVFAIFDNTATVAAPTVNMDLLGAKAIKITESMGIAAYEIQADDLLHLVFDQDADAFIALNVIRGELFSYAAADQTAVLTAGTSIFVRPGMPAMEIYSVRGTVSGASSLGVVTYDLNDDTTTMLSTKITVDANEYSSVDALNPPVISVRTHANNWTLKMDIDTAGTGAKGWGIDIVGRRL